jgi:hypothetical protein
MPALIACWTAGTRPTLSSARTMNPWYFFWVIASCTELYCFVASKPVSTFVNLTFG